MRLWFKIVKSHILNMMDKKERTPEQQRLKNLEMQTQTRLFGVMLEIVAIFLIPALIMVGLYYWQDLDKSILYVLLGIAFVLSWIVTWRRVQHFSAKLRDIRTEREAIEEIDTTPFDDKED